MKKFSFTLATLKEYKEDVLEDEKNKLNILRRELIEMETELEFLLNLIDEKNDELREVLVRGVTPLEMATRKRYIMSKQQESLYKKEEISQKERQIEKQLNVVLERTRDVSTLEKLEEKQYEEYKAAELKENENFIEEFVSNADFRKGQNNQK